MPSALGYGGTKKGQQHASKHSRNEHSVASLPQHLSISSFCDKSVLSVNFSENVWNLNP